MFDAINAPESDLADQMIDAPIQLMRAAGILTDDEIAVAML